MFLVLRVGKYLDVVPGPGAEASGVVHASPAGSCVVGSIDASVGLRLDHGEHAIRVRARDGHADLAHEVRQACGQPVPGVSRIRGLPDAATRTSRAYVPRVPLMVPERSVQDARVARVHAEFAGSGGLVHVENFFPRAASVRRPVDAAGPRWVRTGPPERPRRRGRGRQGGRRCATQRGWSARPRWVQVRPASVDRYTPSP